MEKKSRHSRESGNPVAILFKIWAPWMPAFAGMTKNDTVSEERERVRGYLTFQGGKIKRKSIQECGNLRKKIRKLVPLTLFLSPVERGEKFCFVVPPRKD